MRWSCQDTEYGIGSEISMKFTCDVSVQHLNNEVLI